jgi:hypothetical protein
LTVADPESTQVPTPASPAEEEQTMIETPVQNLL